MLEASHAVGQLVDRAIERFEFRFKLGDPLVIRFGLLFVLGRFVAEIARPIPWCPLVAVDRVRVLTEAGIEPYREAAVPPTGS